MTDHHKANPMKYALLVTLVLGLTAAIPALANHPVLVEGETDFDGDGLLGSAEDADGDRIYGRLATALAADLGAINNNGSIIIVTSGRFPEPLLITGANGSVNIEAAAGVEANIDAVLAGALNGEVPPGDNTSRQNSPGLVVDAAANRRITLRNLTIRNWRHGIVVEGNSHVVIDNCRVLNSLDHGIVAREGAVVVVQDSSVSGTGFRVGAAGNSPDVDIPVPGNGISFLESARGALVNVVVTGNFNVGVYSASPGRVSSRDLVTFDNGTDRVGALRKFPG